MSNRILALLVLFGIFAGFFLMYIYFFVYYTATITIRSNVPGYTVELFGKSVAKTFTYDCPEEVCIITDISPIEYNVTISKDSYIRFFQNIDIRPSSTQEIIITLEKEVILERTQPELSLNPDNPLGEETPVVQISAKEKIAQMRLEKIYDTLFVLDSGNQVGLLSNDSLFEMYYIGKSGERSIGEFEKQSTNISIKEIHNTSFLFLNLGSEKYLYDTSTYRLSEIVFVPEVLYIKPGRVSTELLFVSDKGTFIYHIGTKEFSYFYFFKDFVYEQDSYIGVIYKDEEQKRRNYNLTQEEDNLIIRYTPETQQREVLFRTSLAIEKIYRQDEGIFFEAKGEIYELENY